MHAYLNQQTGLIDIFNVEPVESVTKSQYEQRLKTEQKMAERAKLLEKLNVLEKEIANLQSSEPAEEATSTAEQSEDEAEPQLPSRKARRW